MNNQKIMADAVAMPLDELVQRQQDVQAEADLLLDIISLRQRRGEKTTAQIKRHERYEKLKKKKG